MKRIIALLVGSVIALGTLTACSTASDTAAYNLDKEAEAFSLERHIIAVNGITNEVIMDVTGRCSLETAESFLPGAVEVICKVGDDQYIKNFIILGDNDSLSIEQSQAVDVSIYNYEWTVRPETLIPEIELDTSVGGTDPGEGDPGN